MIEKDEGRWWWRWWWQLELTAILARLCFMCGLMYQNVVGSVGERSDTTGIPTGEDH